MASSIARPVPPRKAVVISVAVAVAALRSSFLSLFVAVVADPGDQADLDDEDNDHDNNDGGVVGMTVIVVIVTLCEICDSHVVLRGFQCRQEKPAKRCTLDRRCWREIVEQGLPDSFVRLRAAV